MSSSHVRSKKGVKFDLSSQDGVLRALYAVRTSELPAAERNDLRDQLFTLSRSPDPHLRARLEERLAELSLSEEYIETTNQAAERSKKSSRGGFLGGRRTPKFTVSKKSMFTPKSISGEDSEPVNEKDTLEQNTSSVETPVAETPKASQPTSVSDTTDNDALAPTPPPSADTSSDDKVSDSQTVTEPPPDVDKSVPVAPKTQESASVDTSSDESSVPQTKTEISSDDVSTEGPASVDTETKQPESTSTQKRPTAQPDTHVTGDVQSPVPSAKQTIDRIREIKRFVNSKIGNPVNLVDLDNQIGRAYMSALLAAMQSVDNETGQAGPDEMAELEKIFTQVQTILLQSQEEKPSEEVTHTEESLPTLRQDEVSTNSAEAEVSSAVDKVDVDRVPNAQDQSQVQTKPKSPTIPEPNTTTPDIVDRSDQNEPEGEVSVSKLTKEQLQKDTPKDPSPAPVAGEEKVKTIDSKVQPVPSEKEVEPPPAPEPAPQMPAPEPSHQEPEPVAPEKGEHTRFDSQVPRPGLDQASAQVKPTPVSPVASDNVPKPQAPPQPPADSPNLEPVPQPPTPEPPPAPEPAPHVPAPEPPHQESEPAEAISQGTVPDEPTAPPIQGNPVPVRPVTEAPAPTVVEEKKQRASSAQLSAVNDTEPSIDAQLEQLDAVAAAQNKYSGDPHYAPEVDMGLEQLLMEWSLFKSSGLFGTGPNGREHPLFKKLAPLMVNDILLGRFEGSRPEIIQSITDYMNGWRYEQGIVYQSGETFEAYLRRVIRYIIDSKS